MSLGDLSYLTLLVVARLRDGAWSGAVCDELFVGCAIADAGLLTNVFAYVFDPSSGRMITWLRMPTRPFSRR